MNMWKNEVKNLGKGFLIAAIALGASIVVPRVSMAGGVAVVVPGIGVTVGDRDDHYNRGYNRGHQGYLGNDNRYRKYYDGDDRYRGYYEERNQRLGLQWLCDSEGHHCYWSRGNYYDRYERD